MINGLNVCDKNQHLPRPVTDIDEVERREDLHRSERSLTDAQPSLGDASGSAHRD